MLPHRSALRTTEKMLTPRSMDVTDPTLRFFLEGEELEEATRRAAAERAQDFGNDNGEREYARDREDVRQRDTLRLSEDDLGPLVRFEDNARKRGALIGLAVLTSLGAIGVAGWMWMTTPTRPGLDWFRQR